MNWGCFTYFELTKNGWNRIPQTLHETRVLSPRIEDLDLVIPCVAEVQQLPAASHGQSGTGHGLSVTSNTGKCGCQGKFPPRPNCMTSHPPPHLMCPNGSPIHERSKTKKLILGIEGKGDLSRTCHTVQPIDTSVQF